MALDLSIRGLCLSPALKSLKRSLSGHAHLPRLRNMNSKRPTRSDLQLSSSRSCSWYPGTQIPCLCALSLLHILLKSLLCFVHPKSRLSHWYSHAQARRMSTEVLFMGAGMMLGCMDVMSTCKWGNPLY